MKWSIFFAITSLIFILFSSIKCYQLWNEYRKLKIGDILSNELVGDSRKKIKVALTFLGIGCILGIIGVLI